MEEDDTVTGGDELSVEQAASAFVKATSEEAPEGQPEDEDLDEGVEADEELPESDEDESEDEGEPEDDEGQPEDEEDDEPESEKGRFVANDGRVRLPDGTVATVADLVQGNLKERDYRQKTMSLADERRQFEEQSSSFEASRKHVDEQRQYMEGLLQSIMPQPPNPSMADPNSPDYDPFGYQNQEARYKAFASHLQYIQQQSDAAKQETEAEQKKRREETAAKEWAALQQELPELKDQTKGVAFANDVRSAALSVGFSPQEIAERVPYDHRMALVLQKAAKWDRLQASKPKAAEKVKGRPPVQKGGKRMTPNAHKAQQATDAVKRLKQSGSVEDAAAAWIASQRR